MTTSLIVIFVSVVITFTFTCIGCSKSSNSAKNFLILNQHIDTNFNFEDLLNTLVNNESDFTGFESITTSSSSSSYGSDRTIPTPNLEFFFQLKSKSGNEQSNLNININYITLPKDLSYLILEFLSLSELEKLSKMNLQNTSNLDACELFYCDIRNNLMFTPSIISFLNFKNPFPFIPVKSMTPRQLDTLPLAAKLINRVYPSLHLKGVENVKEISFILAILYFKCNPNSNSNTNTTDDNEEGEGGGLASTGEMFSNFLKLFNFRFGWFLGNHPLTKLDEIINLILHENDSKFSTSFNLLFQLQFVSHQYFGEEFSHDESMRTHVLN